MAKQLRLFLEDNPLPFILTVQTNYKTHKSEFVVIFADDGETQYKQILGQEYMAEYLLDQHPAGVHIPVDTKEERERWARFVDDRDFLDWGRVLKMKESDVWKKVFSMGKVKYLVKRFPQYGQRWQFEVGFEGNDPLAENRASRLLSSYFQWKHIGNVWHYFNTSHERMQFLNKKTKDKRKALPQAIQK